MHNRIIVFLEEHFLYSGRTVRESSRLSVSETVKDHLKKPKSSQPLPTNITRKDIVNKRVSVLALAANNEIIEKLGLGSNLRSSDQESI